MATQVANWNAARIERDLERAYLTRLHEEVSIMISEQESERAETVARANRLEEVAAYFENSARRAPPRLSPLASIAAL